MSLPEKLTLMLALSGFIGVIVYYRWRWVSPLRKMMASLDQGKEIDPQSLSMGLPLVRQVARRCSDFDKIFQIQQMEMDRSQRGNELLLDSLELFVGYYSRDFRPLYINRYGRERLDIQDQSMDGFRGAGLLAPDFLKRIWSDLKRKGRALGIDGRVTLANEGDRFARISVIPLEGSFVAHEGYLVLAEDVSRQRQVELNLQNQIALSQHIFDTIPEFILAVDSNLTLLFANRSVMRYTGMEKILGRPVTSILSVQAQADGFDEYLRNAIRSQEPVNRINILNPIGAGNTFVDLLIQPLLRGQKRIGALILIRDVTEWRELTEEIRSLQSFTDKVINASPYALLSIDAQDRITVWNRSAEALFDRKEKEALGENLFDAVEALAPYRETITEVKIIGRSQFQSERELEIRGQSRLVNMNFYPVYSNGTNVVVSIEDITAMRALQRSLSEAQKMGALGMLTRGIVHDLNNMLTGIIGRASILRKKIPADSDLQKDVDIITQSGEQVSELISRIHQFSRQRMEREKPVHFNQVVHQTLSLLRPNLQGITVQVVEKAFDLWVLMDQTKISQIVVNLVVNARDAMKRSQHPSLTVELDRRKVAGNEKLMDGEHVQLGVVDNGCGIPRENLDKIFEPYFSTKATEHGTGIGLATVHTLIGEAGGSIEVQSTLGEGTRFTILLPGIPPQGRDDRQQSPEPKGFSLPGLVLLIDDESVVRDIGLEMLQALGVDSLTAAGGEEGLDLFEKNRERIALILLDVEMPGMGGEEVYERLHEMNCPCPVVIASGYNRDYLERQVFSSRIPYYLPKPFQINQLSALLRELDEAGAFRREGGHDGQ